MRRRTGLMAGLSGLALLACALGCTDSAPAGRAVERPLRIGLHSGPVTLDPHRHDEAVTRSILGQVYETLVGFDPDMGLSPQLALRWENPSDLVWRFHLRPAVFFHDGTSMTSADVVASLERARDLPDSKVSGYLVAVREVRALDDVTVELVTERPYPILLNKLAFVPIVPRDAAAEIVEPIGTGPYRFTAFEPGARLTLTGHTQHWQGSPPAIPTVELHFLTQSSDRVERLLSGELDVIHEVAAADLPRLEAAPGVRVETRPGLLVLYLSPRVDRPPFSDPRVRQAVDLALDRGQLVEELLAGLGSPANQMLTRQVFGYEPSIRQTERDLATARRLLAEAGYPDGLDLDLEFRAGRAAEPIARQLAEAGIRVRLVPRPWTAMYPRLTSGEVGFYFGGWACSSGDASDLFDSMLHGTDPARGFGDSNFTGYRNPQLDRLIEESGATLAMEERGATLRQAMAIVVEELPAIPLVVPHAIYGVARDVEWQPRLDSRVYAFEMRRGPAGSGSGG